MQKQVTITSAKLAEECECLGVFVQLLIENLAATLDVETSWLVAVERALAGYGLKVVDAETGQDVAGHAQDQSTGRKAVLARDESRACPITARGPLRCLAGVGAGMEGREHELGARPGLDPVRPVGDISSSTYARSLSPSPVSRRASSSEAVGCGRC